MDTVKAAALPSSEARTETWKRFKEKELSHSMAHYLQAVAALKRDKGYAKVSEIAETLGVTKSGVTSMIRSLAGRGLVDHERYGCVELTEEGRRLAEVTESSRHVLEAFLTDILRVPSPIAHEDACMIEHLVSNEAMSQFVRLTALIQSDQPAAIAFRRLFEEQQRCGASGDACPVCGDGACLERTFRDAAPREERPAKPGAPPKTTGEEA
ncbi:MAG TPA: metal-dependent transcriptional regulator [Candidatus Eisenbacteria bacterium]|nr:metal-dependent transcriptional regulator [Candidatus Eisenbacteria bacterium]